MSIEKTQGITLQSIAYKERQRIISVYTKDKGIISLIIKGLSQKKTSFLALSTPFCLANFIYKKGRSEIYSLHDASIVDENLFLRKDLSYINSAYFMAKAILDSQLPHKQSSSLYMLLTTYLKKIPHIPSQDALIISFLLKLLTHEGLINLKETCSLCEEPAAYIHRGETLCTHHAAMHAHSFSKEEFKTMQKLAFVKSFCELEKIDCVPCLKEKTMNLFKDLV